MIARQYPTEGAAIAYLVRSALALVKRGVSLAGQYSVHRTYRVFDGKVADRTNELLAVS